MEKRVILLAGRKGAGKTTLARSVQGAKVLSYAEPFKRFLCDIGVVEQRQAFGSDKEKNEYSNCFNNGERLTVRKLLQHFGNDIMKPLCGDDVWVRSMEKRIRETDYINIIIDDFRYAGLEDRLPFPYYKVWINYGTPSMDTHSSETSVKASDCDEIVERGMNKRIEQIFKDDQLWAILSEVH